MGVKTLTVITALGLGIVGLVIWVAVASSGGPPGIPKCTSDTTSQGACKRPDGSIWLVDMSGHPVEIQPAHG
jgi:hypothetical protein